MIPILYNEDEYVWIYIIDKVYSVWGEQHMGKLLQFSVKIKNKRD